MENIAPLAKVLAEANGLDWKTITGTGAGGQITEDDVLGHLALIMSGEMEPPSTPVDPEPSPAELAMATSPELLSRAGVDSDLTDLLKMQEDARASLKAQSAPVTPAVSSEDFELDDEPAPAHHEEVPLVSEPAPSSAPAAAGAAAVGTSAVMGGLLSSLYHKGENSQPAAAAPAPEVSTSAPSSVPAFNISGFSGRSASDSTGSYSGEPTHTEPTYQQEAAPAAPAYEPESEVHVPPVSAWAQPAAPAHVEAAYQEPAQTHTESAYIEPAYTERTHTEAADTAPSYADSTFQPTPATHAGDWKGVYLRRDADIAAAEEARSQLAEVLGDLPLSVLVARAAQKSAARLGLSSVAIANTSGEALSADLTGDLRASLSGLSDAATGRQADLLVVNAGALDLDDLHFPQAITLSVGRVQDGKAALSLNGQVDAAQGAHFLSDVAALLSTPVKLLV